MASPLADAHIVAQARLRGLTERAVARIWRELAGYDRSDVDEWLSKVLPVMDASQKGSIALTQAYVARALERQPLGLSAAEITRRIRGRTTPEEVWRRPFVTVWGGLANGLRWDDAVAKGLERATGTAAIDVQMASRGAYAAIEREDSKIQRWQRVADAGACDFCASIDGAIVLSADAMPLHNHCGCGLEPVLEDLAPTPLPAGVAVHEHGELGPVLADPAHDFTSPSDI